MEGAATLFQDAPQLSCGRVSCQERLALVRRFSDLGKYWRVADRRDHDIRDRITLRYLDGYGHSSHRFFPAAGLQPPPNRTEPGTLLRSAVRQGGNLACNGFYGPGINNGDVVLQKSTHISERISVELRTELYNVFNRVQFNQPGNFISGRSTGEVRRAG